MRKPTPTAWCAARRPPDGDRTAVRTLPTGPRGRIAWQTCMRVLAAIPLGMGSSGLLAGPAALPGNAGPADATLDSEYRFLSTYWLVAAPVVWRATADPERHNTTLNVLLGTVFAGGLGRLLSLRQAGRPHPAMLAALGAELLVAPALAVWQAAIVRELRYQAVANSAGPAPYGT